MEARNLDSDLGLDAMAFGCTGVWLYCLGCDLCSRASIGSGVFSLLSRVQSAEQYFIFQKKLFEFIVSRASIGSGLFTLLCCFAVSSAIWR